jgi:uncharacterized repeat protein (TIGR03837 family)
MRRMLWDIFCRVIDNHGDLGVSWRLARDLAARGESVCMWVDDPGALHWMGPGGAAGVDVQRWDRGPLEAEPGDVVVEAFGCDPPMDFIARMAQRRTPPVWINLEYLSAEAYVERSHRLPSPQGVGPARGLTKWFFYPGFTPATGGLLREPGLLAEREAFDRDAWLAARGLSARPGERIASLFCYENAALPALLLTLAASPTLLLATPGAAQRQVRACRLATALRVVELPWLTQPDYDRLLWSCDLNLVRGEDSFVRAQWAGAPFVWQIYPQRDGAHAPKLDAFLDRFLDGAEPADATAMRSLWRGWNALAPWPERLPGPARWRNLCRNWRRQLAAQPDLGTQLLGFVAERR